MKMYNDYLLIEPDDDSRTDGGLFVPENAKKRTKTGKVVASCVEFDGRAAPLVGDRVLYDSMGGFDPVELKEGDEKTKYDLVALRQIILSM